MTMVRFRKRAIQAEHDLAEARQIADGLKKDLAKAKREIEKLKTKAQA